VNSSLAAAWPASAAPERVRWVLAAVAGVVIGTAQTLWIAFLTLAPQQLTPGLLAVLAARFVPLFAALCCVMLWVTRSFHTRAGAGQSQHQLAWTVGWTVLAALAIDPLCLGLGNVVRDALGRPSMSPWNTFGTLDRLAALWSRSLPWAAILATMWVCVDRYVAGARRSAQALASAQLRLASAQRRALDEQLRSLQAQVDPGFLFDTLGRIEDDFESAQAQRLLDALIRYLRAAQHGVGESASTMGQQAELVRTYLEIESARTPARLRGHVEVPEALCSLPLAPLIVPPLIAWAVQRAAGRQAVVAMCATRRDDAMVVDVVDDVACAPTPNDRPATVAEVGQRLHTLYGELAGLSVAAAPSGGTVVRLVIPLAAP